MASDKSRDSADHRRCTSCGRFLSKSEANLCAGCLADAKIGQPVGTSTEFGRTLTDLGLDVRFLSQDPGNSETSGRFHDREARMPDQSTSVEPPPFMQPPLRTFRDSLLIQARRNSVIATSNGLHSRPAPVDASGSKSVLTSIGPTAAAQRANDRSRDAGARRPSGDAPAAARPIAIAIALICVSAAIGATVPLLMNLLGP